MKFIFEVWHRTAW